MLATLNIISRGVVLNLILNMFVVFGLIHYQFSLHYKGFTIFMLTNLVIICFFSGIASRRQGSNPKINGAFIGLGSMYVILLFLYQFVQMDWLTNIYLSFLWILIGFFAGWIGGSVPKVKKQTFQP
jgi:putative membrane protein (TIGR04086 family)